MKVEKQILARLDQIIENGEQLRRGNSIGQQLSNEHGNQCHGWFGPAQHLVHLVCPNPLSAYRAQVDMLVQEASMRGLMIPESVGELTELLKHLRADLTSGMLGSLVDRIRAEDFDNFIDHAQQYADKGSKNEAGAIAGVVFEDTIRRISGKNGIPERGVKLEDLINSLAKAEIITALQSKRAKVASHVRTKATHAQWDEFDLPGVHDTISVTRELIASKLDE